MNHRPYRHHHLLHLLISLHPPLVWRELSVLLTVKKKESCRWIPKPLLFFNLLNNLQATIREAAAFNATAEGAGSALQKLRQNRIRTTITRKEIEEYKRKEL
ncbi:uncharacterized protein [Rutidosis leptorrhynchoides]|uniref:uncharacterized protein n=1 Tax=Rutidosis leptorrhynchoides TaxID=125765 RepID=UPI003A9A3336